MMAINLLKTMVKNWLKFSVINDQKSGSKNVKNGWLKIDLKFIDFGGQKVTL
jgi:hypothetical protein